MKDIHLVKRKKMFGLLFFLVKQIFEKPCFPRQIMQWEMWCDQRAKTCRKWKSKTENDV